MEQPPSDGLTAAAEEALAAAWRAMAAGEAVRAEADLRRALSIDPGFAEAHGALADLLAEAGHAGEAVPHYEAALRGEPDRTSWHRGLASALESSGRAAAAVDICLKLLERRPSDAPTHRRLARLLAREGRVETALAHAREARFLEPERLDSLTEIADVLLVAGDPLEAVEMLEPALARADSTDPGRGEAGIVLARCWAALGEPDKARQALAEVAPDGADPAALAVLRDEIARAGAGLSPAFVRALFDRYADRFDADLLGRLDYRGPQLVAGALAKIGAGHGLRVLDAGCGTGLAGPVLKDRAAWLEGFDLSPQMVGKARSRAVYDVLHVGELVEVLSRHREAWDLIVAADVLVYVGDLAPAFRAASAALSPGGRFVFTVERGPEPGFRLQPSRRYAHAVDYLRETAGAAGLAVELIEDCSSRRDRGQPVPGLLVSLRRAP